MIRILSFVLLGLWMGSAGTANPVQSGKKELFCPECWQFLTDPGDLDSHGKCLATGRDPVEVEAVVVNWFWCPSHEQWHSRSCGKAGTAAVGAMALLVTEGREKVAERAYCPDERLISDFGFMGLNCPACGKPFVAVDAVERRWFWCTTELSWLAKPCAASRTLHCCSARSGIVLAVVRRLPFVAVR